MQPPTWSSWGISAHGKNVGIADGQSATSPVKLGQLIKQTPASSNSFITIKNQLLAMLKIRDMKRNCLNSTSVSVSQTAIPARAVTLL